MRACVQTQTHADLFVACPADFHRSQLSASRAGHDGSCTAATAGKAQTWSASVAIKICFVEIPRKLLVAANLRAPALTKKDCVSTCRLSMVSATFAICDSLELGPTAFASLFLIKPELELTPARFLISIVIYLTMH